MALKFISILSFLVLALACFAYILWDDAKIPDNTPEEEVWKVKTIDFICRVLHKLCDFVSYLGLDERAVGRPILSLSFNAMHYGIWPAKESLLKEYRQEMDGVPVIRYENIDASQSKANAQAILIYFHGGGWVWLDAEYPGPTLQLITRELKIPTLSVDYRLAPDHPYPAGLDDCLKVTRYVISHHKELGVDPKKIIIAGDSAGGNLAAAVALKLKKEIRLQVLIYPVLQALDYQTTSYRENAGTLRHVLSIGDVTNCVAHYGALPHSSPSMLNENKHISQATRQSKYSSYVHSSTIDTTLNITKLSSLPPSTIAYAPMTSQTVQDIERRVLDPYFMPLMSDNLVDVAEAYIVTAHHDILRDDGLLYSARLTNSPNVKATLKHYREGFHAFFHFSQGPLRLRAAQKAVQDLVTFIDTEIL